MVRAFTVNRLPVTVGASATEIGRLVADRFAEVVTERLASEPTVSVIIATGNSQLPFVTALAEHRLQWDRIRVFHMDEYLGMAADHPASFRKWLRDRIVVPFAPLEFFGLNGDADSVEDEITRYTGLLKQYPPILTVMGIGENGHLAFNDPPAEFDTPESVHVVELDEVCRLQQVGEGHFPSLAETPARALSLTVPALLRSDRVLVMVPEKRKASAVKAALEGPLTPHNPASILPTAGNAELFLDTDSACLLELPEEDGD